MSFVTNKLIIPRASDPRILILSFFAVFISYALTFPGFARTPLQFFVVIFTAILTDVFFNRLLNPTRPAVLPVSALVSSMGVFLLTDAEEPIFYAANAFLTIASKHLLRIDDRHIFNPNNFGLCILLLSFPDYVSSAPYRWGGHYLWTTALFILGMSIALKANRASVALSYYCFFVLGASLRGLYAGIPLINPMVPLFGPGMQLFIFFMITDPKTSPSSLKGKIVYGASIAFLDNYLRFIEVRHAPIFTLFIITALLGLYSHLVKKLETDDPWRTKEVSI